MMTTKDINVADILTFARGLELAQVALVGEDGVLCQVALDLEVAKVGVHRLAKAEDVLVALLGCRVGRRVRHVASLGVVALGWSRKGDWVMVTRNASWSRFTCSSLSLPPMICST